MRLNLASYLIVLLISTAGCLESGRTNEEPTTPPKPPESKPPPTNNNPLPPPEPTPFSLDGRSCRELLIFWIIDEDTAGKHVPPEYIPLVEPGGRIPAFAGLKDCGQLIIDGQLAGPGAISDVGIMIESPDGSEGLHYYQMWWITNHEPLWEKLELMGWRGDLSNDTILNSPNQAPGLGAASFSVPWEKGGYDASATLVSAGAATYTQVTGWYQSQNGSLRVAKTLDSTYVSVGQGGLSMEAGSPMIGVVGGPHMESAAMHMNYNMKSRIDKG